MKSQRLTKQQHNNYIEYCTTLHHNRDVFLINYHQEIVAFDQINTKLNKITQLIFINNNFTGQKISNLLKFNLIISDRASKAFYSLNLSLHHDAWLVFRPGLEAALMVGKLISNKELFDLWMEKNKVSKKYNKKFSGKNLGEDNKLPLAEKFRSVISKINDQMSHCNNDYMKSSIEKEIVKKKAGKKYGVPPIIPLCPAEMTILRHPLVAKMLFVEVPYVRYKLTQAGGEQDEHRAYIYSFLHLYYLLVKSLGEMYKEFYSKEEELDIDINNFLNNWRPKIDSLIKRKPELKVFCQDFGLWEFPPEPNADTQNKKYIFQA